jgi:peptidyl-prolyl cis-trans isomerase C
MIGVFPTRMMSVRLTAGVGTLLLAVVLAVGCSKKGGNVDPGDAVYAKVNDSVLTESGLRALVPSDFYNTLTPEHKKEIIQEWVNNELLYQEALRQKIDHDPEIAGIIENSKRNLLRNELLERNLSAIKAPDESVLQKYYEDHKKNFMVQDREYKVRFALFDTQSDASDFWKKVKSSAGFSDLTREMSKDRSAPSGGDLGVISEEDVEPAVWAAINQTTKKYGLVKISDPFRVSNGWACLIVDGMFEPGTAKPFDIVHDQVLDMYMVDKRDEARNELLKQLSSKAKIGYPSAK